MKNSRNQKHISQRLADRTDYRRTLIQRREEIELKIRKVEDDIKTLRGEPHA